MSKVTFIVQNKNYGCYLRQCLNSILFLQIGVKPKIIGLDAGSTDNSRDIYKKLIGGFLDVTGLNQAEALNQALEQVETTFLSQINSDDYYLPLYSSINLSAFKRYSQYSQDISLIYNKAWQYNENALLFKWRGRSLRRRIRNRPTNINELKQHNIISQLATMFKTEWLRKVGGWNEKIIYAPDYELWFRLAQVSHFVYVPKVTAVWRVHGKNMSYQSRYLLQREVEQIKQTYCNTKLKDVIVL